MFFFFMFPTPFARLFPYECNPYPTWHDIILPMDPGTILLYYFLDLGTIFSNQIDVLLQHIDVFILHIYGHSTFYPAHIDYTELSTSCILSLPMDALIDVVLQPIIALDFILQPIN
uniref:Uncharacterized protein n=1 Tax=Cacopsylla melanoneura TaxID=428564 RepID=A0A8D8QXK8_9HEMI